MTYRFQFRPYSRSFRQVLRTAHGEWTERRGIILQLTDENGQIGYGEIAPLDWFGSENLQQALAFCRELPNEISRDVIVAIPSSLPACQFGFESAWEMVQGDSPPESLAAPHSCLLPTGPQALETWPSFYQQGHRTFKWKIGAVAFEEEMQWFECLIRQIPEGVHLRLDANGGLSFTQACHWLERCDRVLPYSQHHATVEFLEQPLSVAQFDAMLDLSDRFSTPVALDESVATVEQMEMCYQRGWREIVVVKAAIAGFPSRLRAFCNAYQPDVVWSSVFETAIARRYISSHLVSSWPGLNRALGFGIHHWFTDVMEELDSETLWQRL